MKNLIFNTVTTVVLFLNINASGQTENSTLFLDQMFKVTGDANAPFKLELKKIAGNTFAGIVLDYLGSIKSQGTYVMSAKKYLEDGHFTFYFANGQIESEGEFDRGIKVGTWRRFDQNGKRKADKYYPAESADKIRESMMMEKEE